MTATLTGIILAAAPADERDAITKLQATIDTVAAHSAYAREQFVLQSETTADTLDALPVTDETLAVELAGGDVVDLHVLIDTPTDIVLPLMIEADPFGPQPRLDIVTDDTAFDARGLLLALVELWGARAGYHTDNDLMEVTADFVVPLGQLTWLDEELHTAVAVSDVPREELVAGGYLYTLPHPIGDPAVVHDAITVVEAADG